MPLCASRRNYNRQISSYTCSFYCRASSVFCTFFVRHRALPPHGTSTPVLPTNSMYGSQSDEGENAGQVALDPASLIVRVQVRSARAQTSVSTPLIFIVVEVGVRSAYGGRLQAVAPRAGPAGTKLGRFFVFRIVSVQSITPTLRSPSEEETSHTVHIHFHTPKRGADSSIPYILVVGSLCIPGGMVDNRF